MNFSLKWKLFRSRCSLCRAMIPLDDLANALSHNSWQVGSLLCKRCRGEGSYNGRCPICNDGNLKMREDRKYSSAEIKRMHKKCLQYLLKDYKYQYSIAHYETLVETKEEICSLCGYHIYRENPDCPFCKEEQRIRKELEFFFK